MSGNRLPLPLQLLELPNEIISHILAFCDSVPPSLRTAKDQPSPPQVQTEASTPLKKAATLNHRLRKLALPLLFRHVFVRPEQLDNITAFTSSHSLDVHVSTSQIYLPGPSSHRRPPWWIILLTQYSQLSTLTITAPPNVFAEIVSQPIKLGDQWAFKIPYQTIQLKYDPASSAAAPIDHTSILHARPWSSFLVNEGCSLLAYTTYEYFLRNTPSPLGRNPSSNILHLLQGLTSFTFVALFPIYSHVAEITELVSHHMPNLESLTIKLLPDPDSSVLLDSLEASGGHFDVRDPWSEYDTSLTLVGQTALALSYQRDENPGRLRELRLEDVQLNGVKTMIETVTTNLITEDRTLGWSYEGNGLWVRTPTGTALEG